MCVSLTAQVAERNPRLRLGGGSVRKGRAVKAHSFYLRIPGGKYHHHTQHRVHYSDHGYKGVADQYLLLYIQTKH